MKISTEDLTPSQRGEIEVGNVYLAKGGGKESAKYWCVIALKENSCCLLGLDEDGIVCTTANYLKHGMIQRQIIGKVSALKTMVLKIEQ
jgi:hypothetical protein